MRPIANRCPFFSLAVVTMLAACSPSDQQVASQMLPPLGASQSVTVSGLSAGGYMAGQYQVAFSSTVSGAGIVAAGPWGCSEGSINKAIGDCISSAALDIELLKTNAGALAASSAIDPLTNLADDRVLLFHGGSDLIISDGVVDALNEWLSAYVDAAAIKQVRDIEAPHGWPIEEKADTCQAFESPYINPCGYDLAGEILSHLYGELSNASEPTSEPSEFDQSAFGDAELADSGYVYVPRACATESKCRIHVFFHGCEQSASTVGTDVVKRTGFNRWAESNNIIVLYPQVEPSSVAPLNPLGCWDWWGYTGGDYLEQSAAQLAAVKRMVERLQESPR